MDSFHDAYFLGESSSCKRGDLEFADSLVQERIELGPNLILLGAGYVAEGAFLSWSHFRSWSFWLMMIEVEVSPLSGVGIALAILDRHVGAVEGSGEIAAPRKLGARTILALSWQRELQLFEKNCSFGEFIRPLVDLV